MPRQQQKSKQTILRFNKADNTFMLEVPQAQQSNCKTRGQKAVFTTQKVDKNQSSVSQKEISEVSRLRWISLATLMKKKVELILNTRKALDKFEVTNTGILALGQKCGDTTDALLAMDLPIDQETTQKSQIKCLNTFVAHMNLTHSLVHQLIQFATSRNQSQLEDMLKAVQHTKFTNHFQKDRYKQILESFVYTIKYPQIEQELSEKLANKAVKTLNTILNQGGLPKAASQPFFFPVQKPNPPPISKKEQREVSAFESDSEDVVMIDTTSKPIQQQNLINVTGDVEHQKNLTRIETSNLMPSPIQQSITKLKKIHMYNHRLQQELNEGLLAQVTFEMDPMAIHHEAIQQEQFLKWYYARTKHKSFWHELNKGKKDGFKPFIDQVNFTKINVNIKSIIHQQKQVWLYADAKRHHQESIKLQLIPQLQSLSKFSAKISSHKIGNTIKFELKFNTETDTKLFLIAWKRQKVTNDIYWKGVTRWKKKKLKLHGKKVKL